MQKFQTREDFVAALDESAITGMTVAFWADQAPDRVAVVDPSGRRKTFAEVNANANRLVRVLRKAGLKAGDSLALLCSNRAEFVETLVATLRSGIRITPVNWHLTIDEIAYIIADCEAKALVAEARVAAAAPAAAECPGLAIKLSVGGDIEGFANYDVTLAAEEGSDISDPVRGSQMMYTSGTTGRPKGVYRAQAAVIPPSMLSLRGYDPETSVQLCAGPAYHAAPLAFDVNAAINAGVPLHFIDKWDSEQVLRTIAQ